MEKTWKTDKRYHFVKEFNDGDELLIVCKYWRAKRQSWVYVCEEKWLVVHQIESYKEMRSKR